MRSTMCRGRTKQGARCRNLTTSGDCGRHVGNVDAVAVRHPAVSVPVDPFAADMPPFGPQELAADRRSRERALDLYADAFGGMDVVELRDQWDAAAASNAAMLGDTRRFVHFSDAEGVAGIVASGRLWGSRSIEASVFAVPVGAGYVPQVQDGTTSDHGFGRVRGARRHAVVFTPPAPPEVLNPEEAVWRRAAPLHVTDVVAMPAAEAAALLDGSLFIPEPW